MLHALHVDTRAPFARLGEVLGASERTVARRYARLRHRGVINPVGLVDGTEWVVRVGCRPGAATRVAEALARRADTYWVALLSGGTEISAGLRAWTPHDRDDLILQRLPRTAPVESVTAHSVLHTFASFPDGPLSPAQLAALRPAPPDAGPATLREADRPLAEALAADGRAPYPVLAAATGWSESTVARRLHTLRGAGLLRFDPDVDAAALGYRTEVRLWAGVAPGALATTGAALATHPEVAFCAATTGTTNLLASLVCRDDRHLYHYLTEQLGSLPAIHTVQTAPVLHNIKRAGRLRLPRP